jgi:hypothetical protein
MISTDSIELCREYSSREYSTTSLLELVQRSTVGHSHHGAGVKLGKRIQSPLFGKLEVVVDFQPVFLNGPFLCPWSCFVFNLTKVGNPIKLSVLFSLSSKLSFHLFVVN